MHGAGMDHRHFADWLPWFAREGFECYALSRRGRGVLPPPNAAGVTFGDYVDDTRRVLATLDEPAIFVGHSVGGLIAQKLAEDGLGIAAVLVAPLAPKDVLTLRARLQIPRSALPFWLKTFPAIVSGRPWKLGYADVERVLLNCLPEGERRQAYDTFLPESGLLSREVVQGVPIDASRVRCPVLCLSGREDAVVPVTLVRSVARKYGADILEYEHHGHLLMREPGWEAIAADVLTWLSHVRGGTAD
jgi:pimeloyl-ACP methyl ester carboxylesterase